jgi:hypothetical protein
MAALASVRGMPIDTAKMGFTVAGRGRVGYLVM